MVVTRGVCGGGGERNALTNNSERILRWIVRCERELLEKGRLREIKGD
jgi:hypothetical protein